MRESSTASGFRPEAPEEEDRRRVIAEPGLVPPLRIFGDLAEHNAAANKHRSHDAYARVVGHPVA